MKKIVYLFLIGLFIFIPKNVFAQFYNFNIEGVYAYQVNVVTGAATQIQLIETPTTSSNYYIYEFTSSSYSNYFDLLISSSTFKDLLDNKYYDISTTFSVSGYRGDDFSTLFTTVSITNVSSGKKNKCSFDLIEVNYPTNDRNADFIYSVTCPNVLINNTSRYLLAFNMHSIILNHISSYKQINFNQNFSNAEMVIEQQQTNEKLDETNDKLDEANQTSKGIWGTIKEVLNNIINLPKKLIELMFDLFKSLFVPTDEQLYEIINDSKELSENFGFVGESINFFISIFTSLLGMVNANGCIELPEFTIGSTSLFDSFTFWHAQNICLNDNVILSSNINTIRTITSIFLVGLFINFASRQFFNILNKNENASGSVSYDPRTGEVRE